MGQVGRRGALRGWSAAAVDEESASSSSSSSKVEEKEEEDSSKCVDGPSRSGTWAAAARELGRSSYGRATGAEVGPVGGPPLGAAWTGRHGLGGGLPRVRLGAEPCVVRRGRRGALFGWATAARALGCFGTLRSAQWVGRRRTLRRLAAVAKGMGLRGTLHRWAGWAVRPRTWRSRQTRERRYEASGGRRRRDGRRGRPGRRAATGRGGLLQVR